MWPVANQMHSMERNSDFLELTPPPPPPFVKCVVFSLKKFSKELAEKPSTQYIYIYIYILFQPSG